MPCKYVKRTLIDEVEKDCPDQVQRIDVEDDPDNLCKRFKVDRVPRLILMDGDSVVSAHTGIYPKQGDLVEWLKGGGLNGAD